MGISKYIPVSKFLKASALLLLLLICHNISAKETFYVGNIQSQGNYYLKADLDISDGKYSGTITLLKHDLSFPVAGEINDKNEITFKINFYELDELIFNATISEKEIKGNVTGKLANGKFWLKQYDNTVDLNSLSSLVGWYQMRSQKMLLTWGGDCCLSFMNLVNPRGYSLMPENDSTFFEWSNSSGFSFELIKRSGKLYYIGGNTIELKKIKPEYKQERVSVLHDSISLTGTLHYKDRSELDKKKHPLIILVHAADSEHKDNFYYSQIADYFITKDFAVFLYDKRGTGESGGSWHDASFEILADDILKFAETLSNNPSIDRTNITLFGTDQGGLIAPLAASKSTTISTVISCMSSATKAKDQEISEILNSCSSILSSNEKEELTELYEKFFNFTSTSNGWEEYYEMATDAKDKRWFSCSGFPPLDQSDWRVKFWKANSKYDAVEFWQSVTVPSLIIYGMKDRKVPTSASVENMNKFIAEGYKTNIELETYPDLGHNIGKDQLDYIYMWLKLNGKK